MKILLDYLDQIDYNIIETDEDTVELAGKFIDFGILKQKVLMIASILLRQYSLVAILLHRGIFKHIVNIKTDKGVKVITTLEGYKDLLIYPPSVLIESEDDDYE